MRGQSAADAGEGFVGECRGWLFGVGRVGGVGWDYGWVAYLWWRPVFDDGVRVGFAGGECGVAV